MRHRFVPLVALLVAVVPATSWCCACAKETVVAKALAHASVVFEGVCIEGRNDEKKDYNVFTFRVFAGWKGAKPKQEIKVETSGDCGYPFLIGGLYIVYCNGPMDSLETDICTRTLPSFDKAATEEMRALNRAVGLTTR